mmetsp:Transcript_51701/g.86171  ORF Transcript_51701/g.86171 Transcript_51701/m.86171 type:complete len:100 (-) Transcript_51701:72-371(-)
MICRQKCGTCFNSSWLVCFFCHNHWRIKNHIVMCLSHVCHSFQSVSLEHKTLYTVPPIFFWTCQPLLHLDEHVIEEVEETANRDWKLSWVMGEGNSVTN